MKVGLKSLISDTLYREYKRRLNVREVLAHYGAENCREMLAPDGTTEIVHSCLLDRVEPHHKHGDRNPSASVNVEKKTFICYSWWGGDLFHLILKMEGKDNLGDILPVVGEFLDGATSTTEDFSKEIEGILSSEGAYLMDIPEYSARVLEPWAYSHPYIRERGISLDASSKLQIGYDKDTNRIVFPHFWEGKLVGWQQRSIPPDPRWPGTKPSIPKYKNCVPVDTEILTDRGWLTVDELSLSDRVASVTGDGALSYHNPLAINRFDHCGDMVKVSTRNFEQIFTENHSVWVRARRSASVAQPDRTYFCRQEDSKRCPRCGEWKPISDYPVFPSQVGNYCSPCWKSPSIEVDEDMFPLRAKELFDARKGEVGWEFPVAARRKGSPSCFSLGGDQVAELLGWVASDGSISDDVRIYQSVSEKSGSDKVDRVRELLIGAGIRHSEYVRERCHSGNFPTGYRAAWKGRVIKEHIFYISRKEKFSEMAMLMGRSKVPPWGWLEVPESECLSFLEGFRAGDGVEWNRDSCSIWQKDRRILDWIQALCVQVGIRTKLTPDREGYALSLCRKDSVLVNKSQRKKWLSKVSFSGEVWCPTTVDGTWVARRDGCVFITGNSIGFPKSETLYGVQWLEDSSRVVVVESPMSVARAHSLGITNVVATFGAKVSQTQIDYLKSFPEVVLWFDADSAGQIAERKVGTKMYRHTNVRLVSSEDGKDLADYGSAEEVISMIDDAVPASLVLSHWDRERNGTTKKST